MDMMQEGIGTLLRHLCVLLGRFADKTLAGENADRDTGVLIQYNTAKRNEVAFVFHTRDRITVRVIYDLNKTSREYIDTMIGGVIRQIEIKRKERADSNIIVLPSTTQTKQIIAASVH